MTKSQTTRLENLSRKQLVESLNPRELLEFKKLSTEKQKEKTVTASGQVAKDHAPTLVQIPPLVSHKPA